MKLSVDDAPSNPTEGRSHMGEEAPSRTSFHQTGIPPFPNLSARDSRAPTSSERRERTPQDQEAQDRSYAMEALISVEEWDIMMYHGGTHSREHSISNKSTVGT